MSEIFYGRAWIRDGLIYTINTSMTYLSFDTFSDWSDEVIEFEISGQYIQADEVLQQLKYDGILQSDILSIVITNVRPGIVRDLELELSNLRSTLKLSSSQLLIGLVSESLISADDARLWRGKTSLPLPIMQSVSTLPIDQQFIIETKILDIIYLSRLDNLTDVIGQAFNKTPEELDTFFLTYSKV